MSVKKNMTVQCSVEDMTSIKILYGSVTGKAKHFAKEFLKKCIENGYTQSSLLNMKDYDAEDSLIKDIKSNTILVLFVSTYSEGSCPEDAKWFHKYITEMEHDFRFEKDALSGLCYSVCGLGDSLYEEHFNTVATQLDRCFNSLHGKRIAPLYLCDEYPVNSKHGSLEGDVEFWQNNFFEKLSHFLKTRKFNSLKVEAETVSSCCQTSKPSSGCCQTEDNNESSCCKNDKANISEDSGEAISGDVEGSESDTDSDEEFSDLDEDLEEEEEEDDEDNKDLGKIKKEKNNGLVDLEDLGKVVTKITRSKEKVSKSNEPKEMITPLLRKSLEKQGYKLIGSHSGVKLCRWTKSMLRGRGGCYKHTFYGIESHRCMETTPSLACANKCVFCWRHHSNPVGTEWKWKMDGAQMIFEEALAKHYHSINEYKGAPGVKPDRLDEAFKVRHCALSLVGEPIMYPEINKFVDLLHSKDISTFLVTNAQFPDAIKALKPVTQLYVSVDAGNKENLKKIDRPLFKDFWQRYLESLKALGDKQQRTVYRLTLGKLFN